MPNTPALRATLVAAALPMLAALLPGAAVAAGAGDSCAALTGDARAECTAAAGQAGSAPVPDHSVSTQQQGGDPDGGGDSGAPAGSAPDPPSGQGEAPPGRTSPQTIEQQQSGGSRFQNQQSERQSDPDGRTRQTARVGRDHRDLDCVRDFESQSAAQEVLDADTRDPFILDADGDGTACENLGVRGASVRRFRVELARTGPHALWIGLAGALCLVGGIVVRRRGAQV